MFQSPLKEGKDISMRIQADTGQLLKVIASPETTISRPGGLMHEMEFIVDVTGVDYELAPTDIDFVCPKPTATTPGVQHYTISYDYTYTQYLNELTYACDKDEFDCWISGNESFTRQDTKRISIDTKTIQYKTLVNATYHTWNCTRFGEWEGDCVVNGTFKRMQRIYQTHNVNPKVMMSNRLQNFYGTMWVTEPGVSYKCNLTIDVDGIVFVMDPFLNSTNESQFNAGTYNRTAFNASGHVELNDSDSLQELPNNGTVEVLLDKTINMTGNVLLFHFNNISADGENSTYVYDYSGMGNNGTANITRVGGFNSSGKLGDGGWFFDGDGDYIEVGAADTSLGIISNISVAAWVKPTIAGQLGLIVGEDDGTNRNWLLEFDSNGNVEFVLFPGGNEAQTTSTLNDNTWYHVVGTYNGSEINIYLDGIADVTPTAASITIATSAVNPTIGTRENLDRLFNGTIDELAIWNRSLSAAEVKNIYDRQKGTYIDRGIYESEIFDGISTTLNWTNITWTQTPTGEMPNDRTNESADTNFFDGIDMNGNILLFHLNNDSAYENSTYVYDWSGMGNNGTLGNTSGGYFNHTTAKLDKGIRFDGIDDYIDLDARVSSISGLFNGTISIWFKTDIAQSTRLISASDKSEASSDFTILTSTDNSGELWVLSRNAGTNYLLTKYDISNNLDNTWHTYVYTTTIGENKHYFDGTQITPTFTVGSASVNTFFGNTTNLDTWRIGNNEDSGGNEGYWNGSIDELAIWNRSLSATEIYSIYRRGQTRLNLSIRSCDDANCDTEEYTFINITSPQVNLSNEVSTNRYFQYRYYWYTEDGDTTAELFNVSIGQLASQVGEEVSVSIRAFNVDLDDIVFDSGDYIPIINSTYNASTLTNVTIRGLGQLRKVTSPVASTVSMRLVVNQQILFDQSVRTVSGVDDIGVFNIPISQVNSIIGLNNLSIEIKEDGAGSVNLSQFQIHLYANSTSDFTDLDSVVLDFVDISFSSTSFVNIGNATIRKTQESLTFIDVQHTFSTTGADTTPNCYLINNITSDRTPIYYRWLENSVDTGSSGINYVSNTSTIGHERWAVFCESTDTDTIANNITINLIALKDLNGSIVSASTNKSNASLTLTGSHNNILKLNHTIAEGPEMDIAATMVIQSTSGAQEGTASPMLFLNSTDLNSTQCSQTFQRSLESNSDIGTIKFHAHCTGSTKGDNFEVGLYTSVATGETLSVLNASLSVIEVSEQNITEGNLPPIVMIENPLDGENVSFSTNIIWVTTELQNHRYITNITLHNATFVTTIATNISDTLSNFTFDFAEINNGVYNLTVQSCENDTVERLCGEDTNLINVSNAIDFNCAFNNISFTWAEINCTSTGMDNISWNFTIEDILISTTLPNIDTRNNGTFLFTTMGEFRSYNVTVNATSGVFAKTKHFLITGGEKMIIEVIYVVLAILYVLLGIALFKEDANLGMLAGMAILATGAWIAINGMAGNNNSLTQWFAIVNIGIGAYILITGAIEQIDNKE
jgi:hypothetical protein